MKSIGRWTLLLALLLAGLVVAGAGDASYDGLWTAERHDRGVWLQLKIRSEGRHGWTSSMTLPESELSGFGVGSDVRFTLRRAAGTFAFAGTVDADGLGSGRFDFSPDPGFGRDMKSLGYGELSREETFEAALFDISPTLVRELAALGYDSVPFDQLVETAIHGTSPAYIGELADFGYRDLPLERVVEMRIHGVSPDFVRELAQGGYDDVPAEKLIELRIHGIDADFLARISARAESD